MSTEPFLPVHGYPVEFTLVPSHQETELLKLFHYLMRFRDYHVIDVRVNPTDHPPWERSGTSQKLLRTPVVKFLHLGMGRNGQCPAQSNRSSQSWTSQLMWRLSCTPLPSLQQGSHEYRNNLLKLTDLMQADPVPVSVVDLQLLEAIPGSSTGRGISESIKAIEILMSELEERVKAGKGTSEKGAPRVMIGGGHCADPRVTRLPEDVGLAVPLSMVLATRLGPKFKPKKTYATPGENIANFHLASGFFHGTDGGIKLYESKLEVMKLDGFIACYLYNCRPSA